MGVVGLNQGIMGIMLRWAQSKSGSVIVAVLFVSVLLLISFVLEKVF